MLWVDLKILSSPENFQTPRSNVAEFFSLNTHIHHDL